MEKANLRVFQKVDVYNINNGARFSTYVLPWPRASGASWSTAPPPAWSSPAT